MARVGYDLTRTMSPSPWTVRRLPALDDAHVDTLSVERRRARQLHDVLRGDVAWHDVVREQRRELVRVLRPEEPLERTLRQLGERLVRRREDGERAFRLERVDELR